MSNVERPLLVRLTGRFGPLSSELTMTQELIANMLGVRREGVTEAAGKLQDVGLIRTAVAASRCWIGRAWRGGISAAPDMVECLRVSPSASPLSPTRCAPAERSACARSSSGTFASVRNEEGIRRINATWASRLRRIKPGTIVAVGHTDRPRFRPRQPAPSRRDRAASGPGALERSSGNPAA